MLIHHFARRYSWIGNKCYMDTSTQHGYMLDYKCGPQEDKLLQQEYENDTFVSSPPTFAAKHQNAVSVRTTARCRPPVNSFMLDFKSGTPAVH